MTTRNLITSKAPEAVRFFFTHAAFSYMPGKETRDEGRARCARELAEAERKGREAGLVFDWTADPDCDSSEWSDEAPAYVQWQCLCYLNNEIVASLGCIDFGRDGDPWNDPYQRVVEAELAAEALR